MSKVFAVEATINLKKLKFQFRVQKVCGVKFILLNSESAFSSKGIFFKLFNTSDAYIPVFHGW